MPSVFHLQNVKRFALDFIYRAHGAHLLDRELNGAVILSCARKQPLMVSSSTAPLPHELLPLWIQHDIGPNFLESIRAVEKLLMRAYTREQILDKCLPFRDREILRSWKATLKGLRWEAITHFCAEVPGPFIALCRATELLRVEELLQRCWDKAKFIEETACRRSRRVFQTWRVFCLRLHS